MKIELTKTSQSESVLVAFAVNAKQGKESRLKLTHLELGQRLKSAIEDKELSPQPLETVLFRDIQFDGFRHVLVVGVSEKPQHEHIRQLAASVHGALKSAKTSSALIHFDGLPHSKKDSASFLQALTEGLLLTNYSFDELKTKKKDKDTPKEILVRIQTKTASEATMKRAFHEAHILAESVNFSRRLGDMPGNLMTPTILANTVLAAVKGTGIKATVWDKARIKKEKMGGLLGVSNGSDQEPRFIILEYKGAPASKKPICFVGKGLTFDCGGISIKPSASMEEMKYDMCGGANVLGATLAIAKMKLKVNLICLVPSTENLVSGSATKPGDVHFARNGKSFEVNNTDAEGRLILADALCYASEQKPQIIIDAATLTGAIVVALGNTHTGYFTRDKALKKKVETAADHSGEWVWNMPLTDFHVKDMKGTYADLSNISASKGAGSATAAAFLEQFVEPGIPWAHFDIAGTAWSVGSRLPYCPKKGASGAMVRTFVELAKQF
ncbi:MAG: leucyl aminopeptidase [Bdellovibrio sp. CG10_big_fil_rev_8_21_14_0_10_47_8]|nr:MAG: leucyl aminopeptidase [Bdellovibrio sp. CG10_big_fil_rev_8_21_14_0_10_47_8]